MNKQRLLDHLTHDVYCRIKPSQISGVGVFAIKDIPKGTNPFKDVIDYELVRFKKDELNAVDPEVFQIVNDFFSTKDGDILIPEHGVNFIDISFYMNHSKTPNVNVAEDETFATIRDIKKGEELTTDYSTFSDHSLSA